MPGGGDLSPRAINQETELRAVCPRELIISSIGKEGLDLITGTKWEQIGSHFHSPPSTPTPACSLLLEGGGCFTGSEFINYLL